MQTFITALHVVLCIFMILIILLQPAKGDMGAAFGGGGGAGAVFGPRGPASLLQRATTIVAVMFMGTSITLALYSDKSILSETDAATAQEQIQKDIARRKAREAGGEETIAPAPGE